MTTDRLQPGDCIDQLRSDDPTPAEVHVLPCDQPHVAEVFGRTYVDGRESPSHDDALNAATPGCSRDARAYNLDRWSIPRTVRLDVVYPGAKSWDRYVGGDHATCLFRSSEPRTGTLRRDISNLTSDQLGYLKAVNNVDDVASPGGKPGDEPGEYRGWAGNMAGAIEEEVRALKSRDWPAGANQPVSALIADLSEGLPHWRAAEHSTDPASLLAELDAANSHLGQGSAKDVRASLGLATENENPSAGDVPAVGDLTT
ncbi:septum formation family protein [Streptomyces tateyamensis]|uniref:septum formation family protein n=1 Tax=Streptomyces tateyamensis TaxID=565073 RepID=UPI0011B6208B|nr:septum formation family protein [Streptomyces tateyamensis]